MKRKVRSIECNIGEERFVRVVRCVILEKLYRVIRCHNRLVELSIIFYRGKWLPIELLIYSDEKAEFIHIGIGTIESIGQRLTIHVPLAGMIGAITERLQVLRYQFRPDRAIAIGDMLFSQ